EHIAARAGVGRTREVLTGRKRAIATLAALADLIAQLPPQRKRRGIRFQLDLGLETRPPGNTRRRDHAGDEDGRARARAARKRLVLCAAGAAVVPGEVDARGMGRG